MNTDLNEILQDVKVQARVAVAVIKALENQDIAVSLPQALYIALQALDAVGDEV